VELWSFVPVGGVGALHQLQTFNGHFIQRAIGALHNEFGCLNIGVCLKTIRQLFCLIPGGGQKPVLENQLNANEYHRIATLEK